MRSSRLPGRYLLFHDLLTAGGLGIIAVAVLWQDFGWDYAYHGYTFLPHFHQLYGESALWNVFHRTPFAFTVEGAPYTHHPPLIVFFLQASYWITKSPLFARLMPAAFSLATCILFYVTVRRWWGRGVAVTAVLSFVATPMFALFGNFVNFEPPTLFFMVLTWSLYGEWWRSGSPSMLAGACVALLVGCLVDWPAYFMTPALSVHALITRRSGGKAVAAAANITAMVSFGLFLWYVWWQSGSPFGGRLWETLMNRVGLSDVVVPMVEHMGDTGRRTGYSVFQWLARTGGNLLQLVTVPLVAGLLLWLSGWIGKGRRPEDSTDSLLFVLLAPAVLNTLIFNGLAWEHSYAQYFFALPCALASALAVRHAAAALDRPAAEALMSAGLVLLVTLQSLLVLYVL